VGKKKRPLIFFPKTAPHVALTRSILYILLIPCPVKFAEGDHFTGVSKILVLQVCVGLPSHSFSGGACFRLPR
jgi:hypothetical protein